MSYVLGLKCKECGHRVPVKPLHVCEFVLDRAALFAGGHGLRAIAADEIGQPFTREGGDPFRPTGPGPHPDPFTSHGQLLPALKMCAQCHQAPGVHSILSMGRALRATPPRQGELFRTYDWDVELGYTVRAKVRRYDWGLLQGLLEAQKADAPPSPAGR